MRFDGPLLARAWLTVATAAGTSKDIPLLFKTVAVEAYDTGVRLVSTDTTVLLTAFVPNLEHHYDTAEPERALLPDQTVIAADIDGRGRSFLGYVIALAARGDDEEYVPGDVEVQIEFGVTGPGMGSAAQPSFDGMDLTYVTLATPDVEKVYLPVHQGAPVDWRPIVDIYEAKHTTDVVLSAELVERLGKVRKHAGGYLRLGLAGKTGLIRVEYTQADPPVWGVFMPARDEDPSAAECPTCAEGAVCLKHGAGVVSVADLDGGER